MIITLTPNPSLDRTLQLEHLVRGTVNRAGDGRVDPGGKGVNVSRALAAHGIKSIAVLPLGGPDRTRLTNLLTAQGVEVRAVPVTGDVRTNITVAEPDGITTKLNEPGPDLTPAEARALARAVLEVATPGSWVVACGSLPGGVPADFYARLIKPLHTRGARVAIDTSGASLQAVLAAGPGIAHPDLIKPNLDELIEAVGRPLRTLGQVVAAAQELLARGIGTVLASLGADGAVLVTADRVIYGSARVSNPRSTVGAGDALLAGYLSQMAVPGCTRIAVAGCRAQTAVPDLAPMDISGGPPQPDPAWEALAAALAWGSASTGLPGSRMPGPDDVNAITVTIHDYLDPEQLLEGESQ